MGVRGTPHLVLDASERDLPFEPIDGYSSCRFMAGMVSSANGVSSDRTVARTGGCPLPGDTSGKHAWQNGKLQRGSGADRVDGLSDVPHLASDLGFLFDSGLNQRDPTT